MKVFFLNIMTDFLETLDSEIGNFVSFEHNVMYLIPRKQFFVIF